MDDGVMIVYCCVDTKNYLLLIHKKKHYYTSKVKSVFDRNYFKHQYR